MSTRLRHMSHPKSQSAAFPPDTEKVDLFDGLHRGIPHWIFHRQHAFCSPEMKNIQFRNAVENCVTVLKQKLNLINRVKAYLSQKISLACRIECFWYLQVAVNTQAMLFRYTR